MLASIYNSITNPKFFSLFEMGSHQRNTFFVLLLYCVSTWNEIYHFGCQERRIASPATTSTHQKAAMEFAWQNEKRDSYQNYCLIDFLWCLILVALEPSTTSSHYIKHTRNLSLLQLPILFWTSLYDKKCKTKNHSAMFER